MSTRFSRWQFFLILAIETIFLAAVAAWVLLRLERLFELHDINPTEVVLWEFGSGEEGALDPFHSSIWDWFLGQTEYYDEQTLEELPDDAREWIASGQYSFSPTDERWCYDHGACHST